MGPCYRYCSVTGGRNAGIHVFLGCDNDRTDPSSTIDTSSRDHSILRVMVCPGYLLAYWCAMGLDQIVEMY